MKNIFLFVFMMVAMVSATSYSQTEMVVNDTSVTRENDTVCVSVVTGVKKTSVMFLATDFDENLANFPDLKNLARGKIVMKRNEHFFGIISSILPVVMTSNTSEVKNYVWKNGYIQLAGSPQLVIAEPSFSPVATILLYLSMFLIFLVFISSWDNDKGRRQTMVFTITSSLAIGVGIIMGMWLGMLWPGLLYGFFAGVFAGFCAMFFTSVTTDYFRLPFSAFLATAISAGMAGMYAGELSRCGFKFAGPEMSVLWQYLIWYFLICLVAFGIRGIVVTHKNRGGRGGRGGQYRLRFSS
jgi:hypothetical protein